MEVLVCSYLRIFAYVLARFAVHILYICLYLYISLLCLHVSCLYPYLYMQVSKSVSKRLNVSTRPFLRITYVCTYHSPYLKVSTS